MQYTTIRNKGIADSPNSYRLQSEYIVQSARKCFEEKGVRKTTLASIAREANITRELIYYYFSGKSEILQCVYDSFVQDAVDTAQLWCETWVTAVKDGTEAPPTEMYFDALANIRRFVFENTGKRRAMFDVLKETDQTVHVVGRMIMAVNEVFSASPVSQVFYKRYSAQDKETKLLMLTFFLKGIVGLIEHGNSLDDYQIIDICKKTYNG